MKALVTILVLFAGQLAFADGCFSRHLHEAMALNRARLPRYAKLTHGRSVPLSLALLASEEAALLEAKLFERKPHRFLCDAFVSMSTTPAFASRVEVSPGPLRRVPVVRWMREMKRDPLRVSEEALHYLDDMPSYHCMLRHVLESIHRIAGLEAKYPEEREAIRRLIALHLPTLPLSHGFDRYAAPMQARGVPILCRDVPRIP